MADSMRFTPTCDCCGSHEGIPVTGADGYPMFLCELCSWLLSVVAMAAEDHRHPLWRTMPAVVFTTMMETAARDLTRPGG